MLKRMFDDEYTTVGLTVFRYIPQQEVHTQRQVKFMDFAGHRLSAEDVELALAEIRAVLTADPNNNKPA